MSGKYGSIVRTSAVFVAVSVVAFLALSRAELGPRERSSLSVYAVTIRHYGVDAREMERSVAVPLEDALSLIPGNDGIESNSEYGMARVTIRVKKADDGTYAAVRDAAERVYARLPSSAQRPEISSSSEDRDPVWVAAVSSKSLSPDELAFLIDRTVKPRLEKLSGSGEVETYGTGVPEIRVLANPERMSAMGLGIADIARCLAQNDAAVPAGSMRRNGELLPISALGRYEALASLEAALISGRGNKDGSVPATVPLSSIALVTTKEREPDSLSRVDGLATPVVAVMPGGGANLMQLSRAIALEVRSLEKQGLSFGVLSDRGKEIANGFGMMISAMLQGMASIALVSLLAGSGAIRERITGVLFVPVVLLFSAAATSALGFGLDGWTLAGLAIGLGSAVDSVVVALEWIRKPARKGDCAGVASAMAALSPSLVAGSAASIAVLVPLAALDFASEGMAPIAWALAVVVFVNIAVTIAFVPAFAIVRGKRPRLEGDALRSEMKLDEGRVAFSPIKKTLRRLTASARNFRRAAMRAGIRALARIARFAALRPAALLVGALIVTLSGLACLATMPLDSGGSGEKGNTVYAHIELEPEANAASADERIARAVEGLSGIPGITRVRTSAQRGTGTVSAGFDPVVTDREAVAEALRKLSIPGGFSYVREGASTERRYEISVSGEDDAILRGLAEQAANEVAKLSFTRETVLNFKEGPLSLVLRPDREKSAARGVSTGPAAEAIRRGIYGPVAYKRLDAEREIDVRIMDGRADGSFPDPAQVAGTLVPTATLFARADSVFTITKERDAGSIRRRDRQRIASISIRTDARDVREVRALTMAALAPLSKPPGYAFEFDPYAVEFERRLGSAGFSFLAAAVLAYLVLAAVTESLGTPLCILSIVPVSLAVPLIAQRLSGSSLRLADACAFVVAAGIALNASVLLADERRAIAARAGGTTGRRSALDAYRLLRMRISSLCSTCGITVAGSIPLLFTRSESGALMRSLAFVSVFGVAASFAAALFVVPAIASLAPGLFSTNPSSLPSETNTENLICDPTNFIEGLPT